MILERWKDRKRKCVKYVDDCLFSEKLPFLGNEITNDEITVRANKTENQFKTVEYNASLRGMLINNSKTRMICISDDKTYEPISFLNTSDGTKISSGSQMKVLGFNFDTRPNCRAHMTVTHRKFKVEFGPSDI